ncbi:MurR/RpiR family transcriptional regulator [Mycoplasma putrefaciens]|uniref:HTH rpiR-type domain-containing protein n=3 Tax=Mycoplasma putrefaciens TaxID=2123 RepID=M9W904_9MOLU|nr:MurR/RpiR family transcriptional regulator [Mycoplasma putrefaciens]AGJ90473.1 Hypothetical protein MPUT9231_0130 [Mycoplasma putrefaciens Mput9231]
MKVASTISKLKQLAKDQDSNAKITSEKILDNIELVSNSNISKVAELIYTSPATIIRFCKNYLNLSGFSELQTLLRIYLSEQDEIEKEHKFILKYSEIIEIIDQTDNLSELQEIDKIAKAILQAQTICIIVHDLSVEYLAIDLVEKINLLGLSAIVIAQQKQLDYYSKISDQNWLFIVISHHKENMTFQKKLEKIYNSNSVIALFSMNQASDFSQLANYWVKFALIDPDNKDFDTISPLYIVELLINRIVKTDQKRFKKMTKILKI